MAVLKLTVGNIRTGRIQRPLPLLHLVLLKGVRGGGGGVSVPAVGICPAFLSGVTLTGHLSDLGALLVT